MQALGPCKIQDSRPKFYEINNGTELTQLGKTIIRNENPPFNSCRGGKRRKKKQQKKTWIVQCALLAGSSGRSYKFLLSSRIQCNAPSIANPSSDIFEIFETLGLPMFDVGGP